MFNKILNKIQKELQLVISIINKDCIIKDHLKSLFIPIAGEVDWDWASKHQSLVASEIDLE